MIQKVRIISLPRHLRMFFPCIWKTNPNCTSWAVLSTGSSTWENHITSLAPIYKMRHFIISLIKFYAHTPNKFIMLIRHDAFMIEM